MFLQQFDGLRERLLRAGVAPSHVRRYVAELSAHLDDAVKEEMAKGASKDAAKATALVRLGDEDSLADAMLSRPELRSLMARFPAATFLIGPVFVLALIVAVVLFSEAGIAFWGPTFVPPEVARTFIDLVNGAVVYAVPMFIAVALYAIGFSRRIESKWIFSGVALICIAGGFHEIGVHWSASANLPSELSVGFALAPPFPDSAIIEGFFRAGLNLSIAAMLWLWLRRRPEIFD
jgi:hypothetical protein